jgi:hypothetical protein
MEKLRDVEHWPPSMTFELEGTKLISLPCVSFRHARVCCSFASSASSTGRTVKVTSPSSPTTTSLANCASSLAQYFKPTHTLAALVELQGPTTTRMCFDDRDTYTTRTYVTNGTRYSEEYTHPQHSRSWRRKHGLGGSYYPSRYYSRPPSGRYISSALAHQNRYSNYGTYPQRHSYPPHGYSRYNSYPRAVAPGAYAGYSSGYGRYHADNRVAMPRHAAVVSPRSFLLSPIVLPSYLLFPPPPSSLARMRYR